MRKPDASPPATLTVDATLLDDDGAGVGLVGDLRVHVAGLLPGERAEATVVHRSPHQQAGIRDAWAELTTLVRPSRDRQPPTCPAFGRCGGCTLGHFAPRPQADWKRAALVAAVRDAGLDAPVEHIVESPQPVGYRNRSKLVVASVEGRVVLGGYAPRSHDVVDLKGCRLVAPALDALVSPLATAIAASGIAIYDEPEKRGELRYVLLRQNAAGEILATLVTRTAAPSDLFDRVAALPGVIGVVQNVNASSGNALYGAHGILRGGRDFLIEEIAGIRLHTSWRAFFQVNRAIAEAIWTRVAATVAHVAPTQLVDVYCGGGGLGLVAAGPAALLGIEVVPEAIADAVASAALVGRHNARFLAGDAARLIAEAPTGSAIALNPPRRGCDAAVLDAAAARASMLAYVSCNPTTLLRDLRQLATRGWRTTTLVPFDMMPHTPHLEVLALLTR